MEKQHGPARLRVGIFFDGTGNNQANTKAIETDETGSYGKALSNIALLHALYPSGRVGDQFFLKHYVEGIGTTAGASDSAFDGMTGRGRTGVRARVDQALLEVAQQVRQCLANCSQVLPGYIAFDLFGFSRGATAARHLANRLTRETLTLPSELQSHKVIEFIGLFDTVAAIVAPLRGNFDPANDNYDGLLLGLGQGIARHLVQLVAGDERRHNFPLLRSGNDIVVPGVHSNIGGGYPASVREQVLLCKPQSNRVPATTAPERTRAYAAVEALLASAFAELGEPRPRLQVWEEPVATDRAKRDGPEKQVYVAVYREREVSGHLSRVYLSIMRELAVRSGVPFAVLGEDEAHRLPEELQVISDKLHDFALGRCPELQLTLAERALLHSKYVHTSAHWNALAGMRNSSLDMLYINRPEESGRVMHENPLD
ncbi:T6SS phospholipase effector Tle1-like catalytic domain-containing protein [Pseudomonas sp. KU43P]|uniref:phospholipase effector Tle1 domain-containing protein n=1 Tax=Pseudomonas sp. KU43P TaxID=2487887 RepID=UPI0012A7F50B|nr:DUF2235 domain-containing protein [Pseudomonas sp. KU43P]BBH47299.1 hypothetical protein KU43P_37760 [Pseudomonas sp. KU43P]